MSHPGNIGSEVAQDSEIQSTINRIHEIGNAMRDQIECLENIAKPVLKDTQAKKDKESDCLSNGCCPLHGQLIQVEAESQRLVASLTGVIDRIQL
jgi:hypothetical protein